MSRLIRTSAGLAVLGLTLASTATASAQGRYYENETLNRAGRGEVSINLPGSLAFARVSPDGSPTSSEQLQVYFVPALVGGVMVTDFLELRVQGGLQWLRTSIGGSVTQQSLGFQGAVQALFQTDFTPGLGGYAGVGLGGLIGNREASGPMGTSVDYLQYAGLAQVLVGVMVMPGPIFMMRGGFRLDLLFGAEEAQATLPGFDGSTFLNVLGAFELSAGWRFG